MRTSNNTYLFAGNEHAGQPFSKRMAERFRQFRATLENRRIHARQVEELYLSSDRELWDMGLSRGDVAEIAKGTYRRD
jgi:uncharacterized protein YjiS (DUF1127 family)